MKTWVAAKLHGIRVTDASVDYEGSVSIDAGLMDAVGIEPFEQVHVVNLSTGGRWVTYALPAELPESGVPQFTLNGGGARLGVAGDECVVMTYTVASEYRPAEVVYLNDANAITGERTYA